MKSARAVKRLRRRVDAWDVATSAFIGGSEFPSFVDRGLPLLTRVADRSVLWMGVSAALCATGHRRARRAAVRGLASIAVASLLANQFAKRIVPRRRPDLAAIPVRRVAHRVPASSSFPSGHSASAAAFAVGAAAECPPLALPIGGLAAAVAFSRVYAGVHFPSDVLTGAALGAVIAGTGLMIAPARREEPSPSGAEPQRQQPPRPTGQGVVAVVNPGSGDGNGREVLEELRKRLPEAEVVTLGEEDDVAEVLRSAAVRAQVLAVGGGDGTACAAARAAMAVDIPLLVLPAGTFNHFARDAGLPEMRDALEALGAGRAVRIDVGEVAGQLFLNTASLGSYPEFVKQRERWEGRVGKPLAAAVALTSVLRHCPPLRVTVDGRPRDLLMLFVGNGDYEPAGFWPRRRPRLDTGRLDIRFVDVSKRSASLGLLAATLTGGLFRTSRYVQLHAPELTVRTGSDPGLLARDGEIGAAGDHVRFRVRRQALTVYRNATQ